VSVEPESGLNELDWQAFRYVAGELSADEARSFEARLATDPPAQEALSRATALGLCIAATTPMVEPRRAELFESRQSRFVHAVTWLSIGAAATVALWIGSTFVSSSPIAQRVEEPKAAPIVVHVEQTTADAAAWLQLRDLDDSAERVEREFENLEPTEPNALDPGSFDPNGGPVVPKWVVELAANTSRK
jgi:hypothetical protein